MRCIRESRAQIISVFDSEAVTPASKNVLESSIFFY